MKLWGSAEDCLDNEDWDGYEWRIKPTDEQYFVCLYDGEFRKVIMMPLKYIFFKGTEEECDEWIKDHMEMKQVMLAWLNNKQIEIYETVLNKWVDARYPSWDKNCSYRVKPTEPWYVIFAENSFLRVSLIPNLSNIRFFSGTYEECGKWIDEHKSYAEILSAWKDGKIIQYKIKTNDVWSDWVLKECPITNSFEECDWRIKKNNIAENFCPLVEDEYYLSVNETNYLKFTISENRTNDTIYSGTKKECERMLKIIADKFKHEDYRKRNSCRARLRLTINKYSHEKYKRRMTNRELTEYLAKGSGEFKNIGYLINTSTCHWYQDGAENKNVDDNIFIRDFGSDEWREPLVEV